MCRWLVAASPRSREWPWRSTSAASISPCSALLPWALHLGQPHAQQIAPLSYYRSCSTTGKTASASEIEDGPHQTNRVRPVSTPGKSCQSACKPGSVWRRCPLRDGHSSGTAIADRLEQPTRVAGLETSLAPQALACAPGHPYLVLLPVGFAVPLLSPEARCALTAPFHPYRRGLRRAAAGGLISVALSLGSPPAAVSRHRVPMEPGLSSTSAGRS